MAASFSEIAQALAARLGAELEPFEDSLWVRINGRQDLSMTLDEGGTLVRISTPLDLAHDGLPPELLEPLLEKNVPNEDTAGAMLRRRPKSDNLELINVLPMTARTPDDMAWLAECQAHCAIKLQDDLDRAIAKHLAGD